MGSPYALAPVSVGDGRPPMTPARDALATMELVCAAERSSDSGQLVRCDDVVKTEEER